MSSSAACSRTCASVAWRSTSDAARAAKIWRVEVMNSTSFSGVRTPRTAVPGSVRWNWPVSLPRPSFAPRAPPAWARSEIGRRPVVRRPTCRWRAGSRTGCRARGRRSCPRWRRPPRRRSCGRWKDHRGRGWRGRRRRPKRPGDAEDELFKELYTARRRHARGTVTTAACTRCCSSRARRLPTPKATRSATSWSRPTSRRRSGHSL